MRSPYIYADVLLNIGDGWITRKVRITLNGENSVFITGSFYSYTRTTRIHGGCGVFYCRNIEYMKEIAIHEADWLRLKSKGGR